MNQGAFYTGTYRNVFAELGYDPAEIEARKEAIFQTIFYGPADERFYHEAEGDMAYLEDTGNHDARTEGMSYGMMFCVQMNRQAEFDRIWKWAKTYMYQTQGPQQGYFAWSCHPSGRKNAEGAAPDGEEYFAMALFFASHRWGDGAGIFNYSAEARKLLSDCLHKGEEGRPGRAMWDPNNKLIRFVAECDFTDPSYHLPHFYDLFSLWANEEDRPFWKQAAQASRDYLKLVCHPVTGLCGECAEFDGGPIVAPWGRRDLYYSDAYRTIGNIALDYCWFHPDEWAVTEANKLQHFFCETVKDRPRQTYEISGEPLEQPALHPVAITATNAAGSLAADGPWADACVREFWDTPLRKGDRRYYDNCLYFFAYLALSGNYRIW